MTNASVFLSKCKRLYVLVAAVGALAMLGIITIIWSGAHRLSDSFQQATSPYDETFLSDDGDDDLRATTTIEDPTAAVQAYGPLPLELLRYCNRPSTRQQFDNAANFLVSISGPEGTVARMLFGTGPNRYNPNLLPYPAGSEHPYIGFARQSPRRGIIHHEIVYCDMDWGETPVIGRRILRCIEPGNARRLVLTDVASPSGSCKSHRYLELKQGHMDPRIFFSPMGEPLMVVGMNGMTNCLSQYVIDLRAVVPGLADKMNLDNVPVRYANLTELPRDDKAEVEKNWFLLYDETNVEYVHHEFKPRSISRADNGKNILGRQPHGPPQCMKSLLKDFSKTKDAANVYHQATNSLRVTMCDYPCEPSIHNTVLVSLVHIKYKNIYELFYRRIAIVTNVTAPFDIIARTNNLMFAGLDEKTMLYTVSMAWDRSFNTRQDANRRRDAVSDTDHTTYNTESAGNSSQKDERSNTTSKANKLVDDYYHGWINDVVMINIGVNDRDAAVLHVPMRDVLDCIVLCG
ncbi:hypothetical protein POJ06DRAFT_99196 [Lipomyces tetrasporus]|uniref:Uncharacterized protein n=1 Tax=Lipomyces tetrasporus TaxID=54092 RepID=A0AAD7QV84_9ASCO|nr:uncharacterized protein POJ06DRAFT_99196 [Lipomyces tetrasporus]KAJ8101586.1 hypothetical protein POJ06DRAFT_99196 [Lipomyces tetrasporus]